MNKKLFAFMFMFLFAISLASAVKPTQVIDSGCEIRTPTAEYVTVGGDIKSHLHVINQTTGALNALTNDTTDCYLHLYDDTGSHLIEQNYSWDSNDLEWALTILGGNFSEVADYSFYIQCTSVDSICAVSGAVTATLSGEEPASGNLLVIMVLLFFAISVGTMIVTLRYFQRGVNLEMDLSDLVMSYISFFVFLMFYYFSFYYWGNPFVMDLLETFLWVVGFMNLFVASIMVIFNLVKRMGSLEQ